MAFITWKKEFEVGYVKVDDQHKELVRIINTLADAMSLGKGKEELGKVLHFLAEYTITHFKTEEDLMLASGYPGFTGHKKIHEDLLTQVRELVEKFDSGKSVLTVQVMNFLQDWLIKHIQGEDTKLAGFLKKTGRP